MNLNDAYAYLDTAAARGSRLGLERVTELASRLGDPQKALKVIHIAGTNGKGSVSAMLSSILAEAGYKTGCFSSPVLTDIRDSFLINGEPVDEERFCALIEKVKSAAEQMSDKATQFELLAVSAYVYFCDEGCDIAVIECGMGGDLDATSILSAPLLSVITNVSIDHTEFLGGTVGEIASHKAGIIKKGRPILFGGNDPEAYCVISQKARELSAPLFTADCEKIRLIADSPDGTLFEYKGSGKLTLSLSGSYQLKNAALVLEAVEILLREGINISRENLAEGLSKVRHKGRFETLLSEPLTIFDGAHNLDGMTEAVKSIKKYFDTRVIVLMGVMADKEFERYPDLLRECIEELIAVRPDNPRALDPKVLAELFSANAVPSEYYDDICEGLDIALQRAKKKRLPLMILGSLYMYKQIYELINKKT